MRPGLPRAVALLAVAGLTALFALTGGPRAPRQRRGGPPPPRLWQRDCAGKPHAPVGEVEIDVRARPSDDEAVLRADWTVGDLAEDGPASLELVLPEGAVLLDGDAVVALPGGLSRGASTWIVRFPPDRTLDAAVRLRVDTPEDTYRREFYVRLWEVPE